MWAPNTCCTATSRAIVKFNKDKQDVYYKFTMRLMDLKTGLVEWADETEIRKSREKRRVGW